MSNKTKQIVINALNYLDININGVLCDTSLPAFLGFIEMVATPATTQKISSTINDYMNTNDKDKLHEYVVFLVTSYNKANESAERKSRQK